MKRLLIPLVLMLAACDNPVPPPPPKTEPISGSDRLFDTQRNALEKARGVEDQMNAAAEAQRKQLEQATQP